MWRGMTRAEIEDFWCTPAPPVTAVYFEDQHGFASFFVLMNDGTVTIHVDSESRADLQVLADALKHFLP